MKKIICVLSCGLLLTGVICVLLCCLLISEYKNDLYQKIEVKYHDTVLPYDKSDQKTTRLPIPIRLANGTYMPVEDYEANWWKSFSSSEDLNMNYGYPIIENETEAYEFAVTLLQIKNPSFLRKPTKFKITYLEEHSAYAINFGDIVPSIGGDIIYVIKNTGEVLHVEYGE